MRLLEVNRRRNRVILSERQAIQHKREEEKDRLLQELREGEVRQGRVSGISSFGVFVDLGGADGLIHISELSWEQVQSPEDVVKVGDELDVYILKVDMDSRKIALSLRRLQPEPWQTMIDLFQVGQLVQGTVTKLTTFGAFARIEGSIEGLIHISELADRMITHPKEVVTEGDDVRLRIIKIDPERRRLGLSLKQADESWDEETQAG
jgi:small subunit ribosomal protein S1